MFSLKVSKSSIGIIAPVASTCPPPVAPSMLAISFFVVSSAFSPRIETLTFSGLLNATIISLSLCLW